MFAFFSPSPEHLKQPPAPKPDKKKTTLATFFKNLAHQRDESDSEDELLFMDEEGKQGITHVLIPISKLKMSV